LKKKRGGIIRVGTWLALLALFCLPVRPLWADGEVHLLLSEPEAAYVAAGQAFREALGGTRPVQTWLVQELGPERLRLLTRENNLLVPIGMRAVRFVAEQHAGRATILGLMVPRATVERIAWPEELRRTRLAFVYIDQPVERSLALLTALMPERKRFGVIVSRENGNTLRDLEREAARRGLLPHAAVVESMGAARTALHRILQDSEALVLLPDSLVLTHVNLQNLLLSSYRAGVPVIGFSPGLVKAGAVAAVFSSPQQIGWQGGGMAQRWLAGGGLPASQYASRFSVRINDHVARSLGLDLPPEARVARMLGAQD